MCGAKRMCPPRSSDASFWTLTGVTGTWEFPAKMAPACGLFPALTSQGWLLHTLLIPGSGQVAAVWWGAERELGCGLVTHIHPCSALRVRGQGGLWKKKDLHLSSTNIRDRQVTCRVVSLVF